MERSRQGKSKIQRSRQTYFLPGRQGNAKKLLKK